MKQISFILVLLAIFGSISLHAKRIRLLGARSKQPIELANVYCMTPDSTIFTTILTDSTGFFILPDTCEIGFCKITAIGYDGLSREINSLVDNQEILLDEKINTLSELTVNGRRSPYTVKSDRIIFNPEFAAFATSAFDIVCAAPGVLESDGIISIPSKQGVKILIDGKEQKGDLKDVMMLLKSYQAPDIKSVEVISAPSARYSRGNDIGVINIILKKKATDLLGGSASYDLSVSNRISNDLSAALNYRNSSLSASLNAFGYFRSSAFQQMNILSYDNTVRTMHSDPIRNTEGLTLKAALDYTISPKWDMSVTYFLGASDMRHRERAHYDYTNVENLSDQIDMLNRRHEKSTSHYAYVETNGKLSSKTTLSVSLDYYWKSYPSTREEKKWKGMDEFWQDNRLRSLSLTAHTNLDIAISKSLKLDFGADFMHTKSDSKSSYFFMEEGESGHKFHYNENELDVFGQLQYYFSEKWFLSANVKYQYVTSESMTTQDHTEHFSHDRSDFTPSIFLSYILNQKNSFRLSYYYNTVKPTLSALNPMILYIGNDTYRTGNSGLKDGRHFLLSLTYNFGSLSIEPYYEWLSDGIGETGFVDSDGTVIYSWGNHTNMRTTALMVYWGWSGLDWMNFSATQYLSHKHVLSSNKNAPLNEKYYYYAIYPRLQFFLDRNRKFTFTLNGYYISKTINPDFVLNPTWKLSAALLWRPTNQWTISLSGNDLLHSRTRGYQIMTGSKMQFNNRFVYPGVSLTASFVWGKSAKWRMESSTRRNMDERTKITD